MEEKINKLISDNKIITANQTIITNNQNRIEKIVVSNSKKLETTIKNQQILESLIIDKFKQLNK